MLSQALSKIIVIYLLCSYQKKLPEVGVQNGRHCHGGPQYLIYVITGYGYRKYVFKMAAAVLWQTGKNYIFLFT